MSPLNRKVLLALWEWWRNWASSPTLEQLGERLALSGTQVRYELYELEKLGFVDFLPKRLATDKFGVQPSKKAEQLMGRIRELA